MSANNPAIIAPSGLRYYNYQSCLEDFKEARHVVFKTSDPASVTFTKWISKLSRDLPNLTHATLRVAPCSHRIVPDKGSKTNRFPVKAMSAVLQGCQKTLVSFRLQGQDMLLDGTQEEFKEAMRSLSKMEKLQSFHISNGLGWNHTVSQDTNLLIQIALANILLRKKNLSHVGLPNAASLPCAKLLRILKKRSRSLVSLRVCVHPDGISPNLQGFRDALQNNASLQHLRLTWRERQTRLAGQGDIAIARLLDALPHNQTLQSLRVTLVAPEDDDSMALYIDTMVLWKAKAQKAFPTNTALSQLRITVETPLGQELGSLELNEETAFWIRTNGFRPRGRSLDNQRWISELLRAQDDPRITFFLLSSNLPMFLPHLLGSARKKKRRARSSGATSQQPTTRPQKKRRLTDYLRLVGR